MSYEFVPTKWLEKEASDSTLTFPIDLVLKKCPSRLICVYLHEKMMRT